MNATTQFLAPGLREEDEEVERSLRPRRLDEFVGQARGAVLVAAANAGVACCEYAPARVKQAVCGYGRAEKAQMQRMVKMILALPELPTPNHAADALAVAICHALSPPLLRVAAG